MRLTGDQPATPGGLMAREMAEQPDVFERVLAEGLPQIRKVADELRARMPRFVLLAARGTSGNAAQYAKYLVEVLLGLPAGLTSPSTTTVYGSWPDLRDCLMISVSQSGGSPDLVESTRVARECGALTLGVTNAPGSPLAEVTELHLDVLAGPERALPATKTYTAQLLTLYLLVDLIRGGDGAAARRLPQLAADLLARGEEVRALAQRYRFADRLVITARGYGYPTAREAALKIMETSYLAAHAFSGAELLHGPLAMIDEESPVIAIRPEGAGGQALEPVIERIHERQADLCVFGTPQAVEQGVAGFVLPSGVAEEVSPILEILPLQRLAYEIAVSRRLNPDAPRALAKVTETR
ncbi:glucosamine-6-phosphate deaminase [Carbonactinospora thermoautotrophica]|uniref:Glucosamine-6-phosphate deaminase n=2 Tax=Carbonactinospora thermoautotrophica TaxID=1469144 RepID=A0A132NLM8_9ACTN|nr:glucosamine-6-phosphate deaminase [Carbonactinospora thermoautotrophica]KWX10612.1 glucosamine-6-phosphate deaminase [Carbonactinospora thermoautotrophica]